MKRTIVISFLLVFLLSFSGLFAQDQQAPAPQAQPQQTTQAQPQDPYIQQLEIISTIGGRLTLLQNAAADTSSDHTGLYDYALKKLLNEYRNIDGVTEKKNAEDMAKFLCQKLADAGHAESGPDFWRTEQVFSDPLVKAEALRALGKVQAADYLPLVVQLLTDINNAPDADRQVQEQIAYGAIESLESYKDSSGYIPILLASTGRYSQRVRDRAEKALPNIVDNPTEPIISVIKSSTYDYRTKLTALQVLEASKVTTQQKSTGAVAALAEAWRNTTNRQTDRSILVQIRKLSLDMIYRYGTEDTNVYQYLERSYREGSDRNEQLSAIAALSALATDDSVRRLGAFLNDINSKLQSDALGDEDWVMARAIIPALGATGKPLAKSYLTVTRGLSWTSAILRLVDDALKKIP